MLITAAPARRAALIWRAESEQRIARRQRDVQRARAGIDAEVADAVGRRGGDRGGRGAVEVGERLAARRRDVARRELRMRDVELGVDERDQRAGRRDRRRRERRVDDAVAPGRGGRERVGRGRLRARRVAVGLGVARAGRARRRSAASARAPARSVRQAPPAMWRAPCARAIRAERVPGRAPTIQPAGSAWTAAALTSPGSVTRGRVGAAQAGGGDGGGGAARRRRPRPQGRGGAGRHGHHGRRSAAASDSVEIRFRADRPQQRRRGPVALLAVLLPQRPAAWRAPRPGRSGRPTRAGRAGG